MFTSVNRVSKQSAVRDLTIVFSVTVVASLSDSPKPLAKLCIERKRLAAKGASAELLTEALGGEDRE